MMIPVYGLAYDPDTHPWEQWDTGILQMLFDGRLWPHQLVFGPLETIGRRDAAPACRRAVFVIPARHHLELERVSWINDVLDTCDQVLVILVGDEEAKFPWRDLMHRRMRLWVQMPKPGVHNDLAGHAFFFGNGYRADTLDLLTALPGAPRDTMWSFAGQVTHKRRKQAASGLVRANPRVPGRLIKSEGFTRGLPRAEYLELLSRTVVAPCPSGPFTQDTFRFYEALQAGCIPLVDAELPNGDAGYWEMVYPSTEWADFPFFPTNDWEQIGGAIEDELSQRHRRFVECGTWWIRQRRRMVDRMVADLSFLANEPWPSDPVTVVVTTSPTSLAPADQFAMLMETIQSAWTHLHPLTPVVIAVDGVRAEQSHLQTRYEEYVTRVVDWARSLSNVEPVVSPHHRHQALMCAAALERVDTPAILFMEHDTPLCVDRDIDMTQCLPLVTEGTLDILRFHHEASVLADHEHLMVDHQTTTAFGVPLRRTHQFSARPHLANTRYYRRMLADNFPPSSRTMIEDRMHGVVQSEPYRQNRIAIYHPDGDIKRSEHRDGRGDTPKYEMRFR